MDFAGPLNNRMFLVVVDAHTKWIEVFPMSNATSFSTIQQLRTLFAQFGIPRTVVTDNGPCFSSDEFHSFMKKNGIYHARTSPYHPGSNGLAERAVRIFKEGLRKMKEGTISDKLARFLFAYRTTPHTTTGVSPAELMFSRRLQSRFDLMKPSLEAHVEHKQLQQKKAHDQHARDRMFSTGDQVYVRNFGPGHVWLPGTVTLVSGPLSYTVELTDGRIMRRHQDHLRQRLDGLPSASASSTVRKNTATVDPVPDSLELSAPDLDYSTPTEPEHPSPEQSLPQQPQRRYPTRERRAPDRLTM